MRYWDNTGKYEAEADALQQLVPAMGHCDTVKGELWRATTKIYWDYYNNGFGNDWSEAAAFLMDHVALPNGVRDMLYACGKGNMHHDAYADEIEQMVDIVIESLRTMQDQPNAQDMWDWPISSRHRFEAVDYEDDWEDDYDYA